MRKVFLAIGVVAVIILYFVFDLDKVVSFSNLKSQQEWLQAFYTDNKFLTILLYSSFYIMLALVSLPGATVMTLAAGAIFGFAMGTIVVSVASTIGATLGFLNCRYLLRNAIQKRFEDKLKKINEGVEREGAFYLFTLRIVPAFPFFLINAAFGKTSMRAFTFFWVSQVGMLPGTAVYVNAGTQLGKLQSLSGIVSPSLLFSFALLGIFPLVAKKFIDLIRRKKAHASVQQAQEV